MPTAVLESRADRRLSEVAKHVVPPANITHSGWGKVEKVCKSFGVGFDCWQRDAGKLILSKTADGLYATTVGGAGMSLPRQVGKTYLIGAIVFALCKITPNMTVVWTSHHMKTTGETFLSMQGFAEKPAVAPYIDNVFRGSGDEEIRFTNGSRILFGARERGFGRGFSGVDVLVCDEAQILTDRAMDNMLPTMSTAPNPLLLFMGTPPKPDDPSELFERMRNDALNGERSTMDMLWIECGADEGCDPDDRDQWGKANASFPHRTPLTSMLRMRRKLTVESWLREGLGIWDSEDTGNRIDVKRWATTCLNRRADAPSQTVLSVEVSQDRRWSCISAAGEFMGKTLVLCYSGRGTGWVAAKVLELQSKRSIAEVSLVTCGQARALQAEFAGAGIYFEKLSQTEISASCVTFHEAVKKGTVIHVGQPELDRAVANARTRKLGDSETWDRTKESIDDSPLVSAAAAFYRWGLLAPIPVIY